REKRAREREIPAIRVDHERGWKPDYSRFAACSHPPARPTAPACGARALAVLPGTTVLTRMKRETALLRVKRRFAVTPTYRRIFAGTTSESLHGFLARATADDPRLARAGDPWRQRAGRGRARRRLGTGPAADRLDASDALHRFAEERRNRRP